MRRILKFAQPALAVLLLGMSTPARAQVAGANDLQTMEQFAPMLEMMKRQMGKKRFGQLMQTVGPIMDQVTTGEGSGAAPGYGGFGDGRGFDIGGIATLVDAQTIAGLVEAFGPAEAPRPVRRQARRARN